MKGHRWGPDVEARLDVQGRTFTLAFFREGRRSVHVMGRAVDDGPAPGDGDGHRSVLSRLPAPERRRLRTVLSKRRLICGVPAARSWVWLWTGPSRAYAFSVATSRPLRIDILCGDEARLARCWSGFVAARTSPGGLVAFLRVRPRGLLLGPIRLAGEAVAPPTAASRPRIFFAWRRTLARARGLVRRLFESALTSPSWYLLSARGMRISLAWEEARELYEECTTSIPAASRRAGVVLAAATVEEGLPGCGCAQDPAQAVRAARGEAWERYCLERPDLRSRPGERDRTLSPSGIYPRYLEALTKMRSDDGGQWVCAQTDDGRTGRLPVQWIYLLGGPSAANTSGAAFGETLADAEAAARLELIERHALVSAFFGLGASARMHATPSGLADLARSAPGRTLRWYRFAVTGGVDVVACCSLARRPPYLCLGVAARTSTRAAVQKSLFEALAVESMWARKIEMLGPRGFERAGQELAGRLPVDIGLEESGMLWAALPEAGELFDVLFSRSGAPATNLDPSRFVLVDIGARILRRGHVVKAFHPDALPLPSCLAHAQVLAGLLGQPSPLPLPMT